MVPGEVITKFSRIRALVIIGLAAEILIWAKVVDWAANIAIPIAMLLLVCLQNLYKAIIDTVSI